MGLKMTTSTVATFKADDSFRIMKSESEFGETEGQRSREERAGFVHVLLDLTTIVTGIQAPKDNYNHRSR